MLLLLGGTSSPAVAAPEADPWPFWAESEEQNGAPLDHGAWQALLDRYLVRAGDGRTLFRYRAVTPADRARLDGYLSALAALDPRRLSRREQLAYWINLYNALTVRVVLDHPEAPTIRAMGDGFFRRGPWNDPLIEIAGQPLTLNDIEHRILRPLWQDRRVHFALNCASLGCPDLDPRAYTGANAKALMAAAEQHYLQHPRGLTFDADGRLVLSSLFRWYRDDFASSRRGLLDYLAEQRPDLAARLRDYRGPIDYRYDWALNAVP